MRQHYFAARLRELREARGWSQHELAERSGLHAISLSRFENGTRKPTWETVLALADALGVECTAFCQEPTSPVEKRSRGRPPKQEVGGLPPATPAAPPAEDLEGQAEAGPAATRGAKPKRPRARRPKGK